MDEKVYTDEERERLLNELNALKKEVAELEQTSNELFGEEQYQEQYEEVSYDANTSNNDQGLGQFNIGKEKIGPMKTKSLPGINGVGVGQNTYNSSFFNRFGNRAGTVKMAFLVLVTVITGILAFLLFIKV